MNTVHPDMGRDHPVILLIAAMFALTTMTAWAAGQPGPAARPAGERGMPVRHSPIRSFLRTQVHPLLYKHSVALDLEPTYDVRCIALVYTTINPHGELVEASGLLVVPRKSAGKSSPMLSLQHGTILHQRDTPSTFSFSHALAQLSVPLASQGYVVVMPDYLGYGVSKDVPHPYLHAATLAANTVDMIRAARRFLGRAGIRLNDQVFLAGYSEGGYATLAAQREIEARQSDEFKLVASVPAAGPYDLSNTVKRVLAGDTVTRPAIAIFLFRSYDAIYNRKQSRLSWYFRQEVLPTVQTIFTDEQSKSVLDEVRTTTALFAPGFLAAFNGQGETDLKRYFAENDIYDWKPSVPTRLFHGRDDEVVPVVNAHTAVRAMRARGAKDVQAVACTGVKPTNHAQCFTPFVVYTKEFLQTLARDL